MSMDNVVHLNYGQLLQVEFLNANGEAHNLSAYASSQTIVIIKPNQTKVTLTAEFVTDGSDGLIEATIEEGNFEPKGTNYIIYGVVTGTNKRLATRPYTFKVH